VGELNLMVGAGSPPLAGSLAGDAFIEMLMEMGIENVFQNALNAADTLDLDLRDLGL
jgi:hypothetical protein